MADLLKKIFSPISYDEQLPRYGRVLLGHPVHPISFESAVEKRVSKMWVKISY